MLRFVLMTMFFVSGATALVYEIIWEKYMALFLGAGAYSQAIVLSTFMLGLGIGSHIFGKLAERIPNLLLLYAALELGIGFFALVFPGLMQLGEFSYVHIIDNETPFTIVLIAKFCISFAIMAGPATLIGGTMPVLSKIMIRSKAGSGRTLSQLYCINCLGATFGCIISGFFLVAVCGLKLSMFLAAAINILIALIAYAIRHHVLTEEEVPVEPPAPMLATDREVRPDSAFAFLLAAAFLSGLAAMLYEVVWIRILSNVLGSSTYSFSLMLAVFILGIAVGSIIVSAFIDRIRDALLTVVVLEVILILSVGLSLPLINVLPYIFTVCSQSLVHTDTTFYVFSLLKAVICAAVLFPVSLFSGMILPVLGNAALTNVKNVGERIGTLFACNTFGTILAALLTGLVIMPAIGIMNTIFLGLGINLVIVLALLPVVTRTPAFRIGIAAAAFSVVAGIYLTSPQFDQKLFLMSVFRHSYSQDYTTYQAFADDARSDYRIVTAKQGVTASIVVTEQESVENRTLYINGKADASTSINGDLITQSLLGVLPLLIKPGSQRVLVVGLGTGTTAHVTTLPASVDVVDVVEISREVVETLPYFESVNGDLLNDPKVNMHVEDAKTYLNLNREKYDLIINEPSNPWISGIGNLFSREYYEQVVDSLNPGGTFVQWLQVYETSDEILLSVLYTLKQVFPHLDAWYSGQNDLMITAYKDAPLAIDFERSRQAFAELKNDLSKIRINSFEEIILRHVADTGVITEVLEKYGAFENSDTFPFIEFEAPKQLFVQKTPELPLEIDQRLKPRKHSRFPFFDAIDGKTPDDFFRYFKHFHIKTPLTERMSIINIIHNDRWYIQTPWSRSYDMAALPKNYEGADTKDKKSWFIKELFEDYRKLTNCFVQVPYVPFLREKIEAYLRTYPDDNEIRSLHAELLQLEF